MNDTYIVQNQEAINFLELLRNKYITRTEKGFQGIRRYYDTFDWRVYNSQMQFYSDGKNFTLISQDKRRNIGKILLSRRPAFIWDIPDKSNIHKYLKPVIQVRALSRIQSVKVAINNIRILNKDEKTIAFVITETCIIKNEITYLLIKIQPLRGYETQAAKIVRWFEQQQVLSSSADMFELVSEHGKEMPGSYSSKLHVELQPESSVAEAVHKIHKNLHTVMQQNENGIIKDIDTEFLHDYRVAVRRIRSLYSPAKKILSRTLLQRVKKDYVTLGKLTNRMRDIDVYLLNTKKYMDYMPDNMREHLISFFENLRKERVAEHRKLARYLKMQSYKNKMKYWSNYLTEDLVGDELQLSIKDFAQEKIIEKFSLVLSQGQKILPGSPDDMVHQLRIDCKKLRYLLEFYASLFPAGLVLALVCQLKILQDYLGEFNDYSVQQITLHEYIDKLPVNTKDSKLSITALGFLIGKLNERQMEVRKDFSKTFRKFANPETQRILDQLKAAEDA